MDEEKTIDEEKTVDEAVEEMTGEMKEFEPVAFDEVIKETEPERKDAPILRALGDPDPADMNMIHKHVDNFLAKIAGETPIDENVRDSTEYWLKRIAEAGGVKPLYLHHIRISSSASTYVVSDKAEAYTNATFAEYLISIGADSTYRGVPVIGTTSATDNALSLKLSLYAQEGATIPRIAHNVITFSIVDGQIVMEVSLNTANVSITDDVYAI